MSMIELIELIGNEGKDKSKRIMPSFFIAKITKIKPSIEISFNGMTVYSEQIRFTSNFKRMLQGINTETSNNHKHRINLDNIKINDEVFIYKLNDSEVLIIDKVVR